MYIAYALLGLLLLAACTIQPKSDGLETQFNPPLVKRQWRMASYEDAKGRIDYCELSANSLIVSLWREGNTVREAVRLSHKPVIGEGWTVRIEALVLRSREEDLTARESARLIAAMQQGGTAYVEWLVPQVMNGQRQVRHHDSIKLDDFSQAYGQCRKELGA